MRQFIKNNIALAFAVLGFFSVKAQQTQLSFFHLGDYVQQTQDISPVYIPKNSFSISVPGASLGLSLSNGFSYKDAFPINENNTSGETTTIRNIQSAVDALDGDTNNLQLYLTNNILNLAFKREKGSLSFFINEKTNIKWDMNKNGLLSLLAKADTNGEVNDILIDDNIDITSYAEAGVGFTQQFLDKKLAVALRLKYILGMANASTEDDGFARLDINDDLDWIINANNATARVAGIPLGKDENGEDKEFEVGSGTGFGVDLGATYEVIPNLVVEAAINDIGSIKWSKNVTEYFVEDANDVLVRGTDLGTDGNIGDALLDELEDDVPNGEREGDSYTTSLATSSYLSASYLLGNIHKFRATMFNRHSVEDAKPIFGLGYNVNLKKTTYGVIASTNDQGELDYGINLATKLGPLQLYLATDNLNEVLGAPEEITRVNLRFGLNFVFGYNKWIEE